MCTFFPRVIWSNQLFCYCFHHTLFVCSALWGHSFDFLCCYGFFLFRIFTFVRASTTIVFPRNFVFHFTLLFAFTSRFFFMPLLLSTQKSAHRRHEFGNLNTCLYCCFCVKQTKSSCHRKNVASIAVSTLCSAHCLVFSCEYSPSHRTTTTAHSSTSTVSFFAYFLSASKYW